MGRRVCLLGPVAAVTAWVVIAAAWAVNRDWFVFTRNAFSDLGGEGARHPWLFNYGLVATGVLVAAFSACPYSLARDKLEVLGAGLLQVAGVFLALIGLFPEGTRPHAFVSVWFFIQMDAALAVLAAGAYRATRDPRALAALALSLAGFPVYAAVELALGWPSIASAEAYGAIVIDAATILLTLNYLSYARRAA
ncbi:DUF998 domain-containing protein [Stetteria hydrogenophila]